MVPGDVWSLSCDSDPGRNGTAIIDQRGRAELEVLGLGILNEVIRRALDRLREGRI